MSRFGVRLQEEVVGMIALFICNELILLRNSINVAG